MRERILLTVTSSAPLSSCIKSGSVHHRSEFVYAHFTEFQAGLNQSFYFKIHSVETGSQSFYPEGRQKSEQKKTRFPFCINHFLRYSLSFSRLTGKEKHFPAKAAGLPVTSALATIPTATCAATAKRQQTEGRLGGEKKVGGD